MVFQPRLFLVYAVAFPICNPEDIAANLLSGEAQNPNFSNSWLPEKEVTKFNYRMTHKI